MLTGSGTADVPLERLIQEARLSQYRLVRDRPSGPDISLLEPRTVEEAHERSLSASYGVGAQPLHTDGAHHSDPPDYVLLSSDAVSMVPTLLWRFRPDVDARALIHDLRHGLFTVRAGRSTFLATAFEAGHIRYDPGCMEPADARAQRVAAFFATKLESAVAFSWVKPGLVLAVSNRHVLHARADASDESERTLRRVALRVSRLPSQPAVISAVKLS
jgi:hypothetical protein